MTKIADTHPPWALYTLFLLQRLNTMTLLSCSGFTALHEEALASGVKDRRLEELLECVRDRVFEQMCESEARQQQQQQTKRRQREQDEVTVNHEYAG